MATVFVVTSNADAGPGTLRQAILQATANGSTDKDEIRFDFADVSETGRTITLLSSLPELPSNLLIDGTTQAGAKIGISYAKVAITMGNVGTVSSFNCFWATNKTDIEVVGIYFKNIAIANGKAFALNFNKSNLVTVGRANKGNVFESVDMPVSMVASTHTTVSGNMFGINPKTSVSAATNYSTGLYIAQCSDVKIGGDNMIDGNVFVKAQSDHPSVITDVDNCTFKWNFIGHKATNGGNANDIRFSNIGTLYIFSNIYNYGSTTYISNITKMASLRGNRTNLDRSVNPDAASNSATPFKLDAVKKAIIGGTGLNEGNILSNFAARNADFPAIETTDCYDVQIQRNIIQCKTTADAYVVHNTKSVLPVISITSVNGAVVSGTATPGADIEIFSDSPCQLCEPAGYAGTVKAAANGSWTYTAATASSGFTASATINGRTSLFVKVGYDATAVITKNPTCGQQNGSIKGIKVVNSTRVEWTDPTGKVVANTLNAENLGPGKYTFKAWLGPYCSTQAATFTLAGIVMDETAVVKTEASCLTGKGAITNIKVSGATSYQWLNSSNKVVATSADLTNAPIGDYRLVASTATCSRTSQVYTIKQQTNTFDYNFTWAVTNATCGLNNGAIKLNLSNDPLKNGSGKVTIAKPYRWVNHVTGTTITQTAEPLLINIDAGVYDIYVTNENNCERFLASYTVNRIPPLTAVTNKVTVTNDLCTTRSGSIKGIVVTGSAPIVYSWTNNSGAVVGNTADLLDMPPGIYRLKITDASGCEIGVTYNIYAQDTYVPAPNVNDVKICSSGDAVMMVNTPAAKYTYRLYETGSSIKPLAEDKNGRFKLAVKSSRSYYISTNFGKCESSRTEVKVMVGIVSADVANSFSPNGDGINENWVIKGIENYPKANIQLYTRSGGKVFESTGYSIPFNGTYNGNTLPMGTYYYIINLNSGCSLLSGTLTLMR